MCGVNLFGYLGFLAGVQSSMSCDGVGRRGVLGGGGGVLYSSAVCRSGVSCDSGRGGSSSSGASSSSRSAKGGGGEGCVTFCRVAVSLRNLGQSPVRLFACCSGSMLSDGRYGRCSLWCCCRVSGS